LVYYYNERKDFDNAAKFMGWGVILVCAGVFLKMAPTKLYGDSGFLRAYILSFLLSAVCGWYMLGIVENYKDGADTPVTLMKRQRTKLEDMGTWNLTFEAEVVLNFNLDESNVPRDLAAYDFRVFLANKTEENLNGRFELEKLPTTTTSGNFGRLVQTVKSQVNFDTIEPSCDRLPGLCYAVLGFGLRWDPRAIKNLKELSSLGEDPIRSAFLRIRNPSSEADTFGLISLPHEEDPPMAVLYDVDAHQRKKIDGSGRKWFEFSVNNNVPGQIWENIESLDLSVTFLIETNKDGEVWTRVMEEKPLFSASQAFTSFLAFCSALFAFFSYFFPKTLPKRRVKFSSAPLKFEAGSTFDVLEVTQVTEMVGKSSDSESGDNTEPREKTKI